MGAKLEQIASLVEANPIGYLEKVGQRVASSDEESAQKILHGLRKFITWYLITQENVMLLGGVIHRSSIVVNPGLSLCWREILAGVLIGDPRLFLSFLTDEYQFHFSKQSPDRFELLITRWVAWALCESPDRKTLTAKLLFALGRTYNSVNGRLAFSQVRHVIWRALLLIDTEIFVNVVKAQANIALHDGTSDAFLCQFEHWFENYVDDEKSQRQWRVIAHEMQEIQQNL